MLCLFIQSDRHFYGEGILLMNRFSQLSPSAMQSRQQLERLWQTPQTQQPDEKTAWLKRLGQWLLQSLTDSEQVRLWTKITPTGTQWYAYDPKTQRRFSCHSEADLRMWLETRYQ